MPYTDPTDFVLGRGGANWGTPSSGWWNTPSLRSYGGYGGVPGAGGGGSIGLSSTRATGGGGAAGFNYSSGVAAPTAGLGALTEYINSLNRTAQTLANQARIPNAPGLEAQSSANIGANLRGEVPADVLRILQRQGAERGISVGPESPNTNAAYLQALGLTSLGLQETGQRDLTAAYARNPGAPLFDPTSQLLTPAQANQLALEQERLQLERDRMALEAARAGSYGSGGGGGGRYAGGGAQPTGMYVDPATRTYGGATGNILAGSVAPDFSTRDWWASIGYGAPGTETATGPGTFYAGPSYGGMTESELYQNFGLTGEDYTSLGLTNEDLYP